MAWPRWNKKEESSLFLLGWESEFLNFIFFWASEHVSAKGRVDIRSEMLEHNGPEAASEKATSINSLALDTNNCIGSYIVTQSKAMEDVGSL